jgi:acyl-coenzyme A synthetase/AMP-(fatty) acid ligase
VVDRWPEETEAAFTDDFYPAGYRAYQDEDRGSVVKAYVVVGTDHEPSDELAREIQDFCKSATAPYRYPRLVEFVAELPKTTSGKIRRVELRRREMA